MNGWSESLRRELLLDVRVTLIEPGAVATDVPTHITHGETRQGVEQLYSHIEVTADDIAKVIAFVIGRPRRLAIHEEVLLRQPLRSTDGRPSCPASAAVEEAKGTAGNAGNGGERRRPLPIPRTARTTSVRSVQRIGRHAVVGRSSSMRHGEVMWSTIRARGPRGSAAAVARAMWLPIRLPTTASASTVAGRT